MKPTVLNLNASQFGELLSVPITGNNFTQLCFQTLIALNDATVIGLLRSLGDAGASPANTTGKTLLQLLTEILAKETLVELDITGEDFATETTLSALAVLLAARIPASPATEGTLATLSTEATLASVLAALGPLATEATVASILAAFAPLATEATLALQLDVMLSTRALEAGGNLETIAGIDFATETTLATLQKKATSPTILNKTLTNADTEYDQALPADTKKFTMQCRTTYDVRFAFETGKVATPTAPYATMKASNPYTEENLEASITIYLASAQAGVVVEIVCWT
jgi:hypothetical protein